MYCLTKKSIIIICLYLLIWTLAPTLLASSVALDVSEGINWGSEWQWGYYKHPPLSSWVLYSFYTIFAKLGMGVFGAYLLSQICVGITLYCNYQLGKLVWSKQVGVLGSILTMGVFYYTYPTLEFNHNIAQFPIWSGLTLAFYLAVTQNRWSHWLWVALLGGIGMLTKYSVIFLLLPMALYLLYPLHSHYTQKFQLLKSAKPWVCAILMLIIFSPHLSWLITNDWLPLSYAQDRGRNTSWLTSHFSWVSFTASQLLIHIPLLIIVFFQKKHLYKLTKYKQGLTKNQKLIWYLWLSPLLILWIISLVFGVKLKDMWGMPMWGLSGLIAASFVLPNKFNQVISKMTISIVIWLLSISILMMTYLAFGHQLRDKPSRMDWNEQAIAAQAKQTWQKYSRCELDSISGDRWLTALVALHTQNNDGKMPSQIFEGAANKSPWMNEERLMEHGTLIVWQQKKQDKDQVSKPPTIELFENYMFPVLATYNGQWSIPWSKNPDAEPLIINWTAHIPKQCLIDSSKSK